MGMVEPNKIPTDVSEDLLVVTEKGIDKSFGKKVKENEWLSSTGLWSSRLPHRK